jgi:hypothetical protein
MRRLLNDLLGKASVSRLNSASSGSPKRPLAAYDIVSNPDLAATEELSILILILGKIKGTFGEKLTPDIDYSINASAIVKTQNRSASQAIIDDYSRALNSINRTKWIQDLLNKK